MWILSRFTKNAYDRGYIKGINNSERIRQDALNVGYENGYSTAVGEMTKLVQELGDEFIKSRFPNKEDGTRR